MLKKGDVREIWPPIKELSVMHLLMRQTTQIVTENPDDLLYGCREATLSEPISVAEVHALTCELIGEDMKPLHAAAGYNRFRRGGTRHWAETAVENLRDSFPKEWRLFVKQFDSVGKSRLISRTLRELYSGVSKDEAYRGLLASAATTLGKDPAALNNSVDKVLGHLEGLASLQGPANSLHVHAPVRMLYQDCDTMLPPFSGLSDPAKVAGLIGSSLLTVMQSGTGEKNRKRKLLEFFIAANADSDNVPAEHGESRRYSALNFFQDQLGITKPLYRMLAAPLPEGGKTPEASVWQALLKPASPGTPEAWDFGNLADESRQKADMIQTRFREPLAQFLYSRTGCVFVNANSGDFRGYRDYTNGDSLRQVDWKRSVKDGQLSVRLRDEEEVRGLRLIYDTEHLINAYKQWKSAGSNEQAKQDNPLRELFVLCHLAALENVQVDMVLFGRSHMATLENVVGRSTSSPRGRFNAQNLITQLETHMRSADEVFEAEKVIYGKAGMPNVNIFGSRDLTPGQGQLHIFTVSGRNDDAAYAQREGLKKRRILSASMSETRDPRLKRNSSNG
jgi:hypothetical protein